MSSVSVENSSIVNSIEDIYRLFVGGENTQLYIKGGLKNVLELYSDGTIKVNNGSIIDVGYIYGSTTLDIEVADNDKLIEGTYIRCKRNVEDIKLSDRLNV